MRRFIESCFSKPKKETPDPFSSICEDNSIAISDLLNLKDKAVLARLSKSCNGIFQNEMRALKLIGFISQGKRDSARQLVERHPEIISIRTNVTDLSNRTFEKISSFQYAFWAMDIFSCRMLLEHMHGKTIESEVQQCKKMLNVGISFKQGDRVILNSKQYDFKPILDALTQKIEALTLGFNREASDQATRALLAAQRDAPAHVVQEYVRSDRSFDPCPEFDKDITSEMSCNNAMRIWFPEKSASSLKTRLYRGVLSAGIFSMYIAGMVLISRSIQNLEYEQPPSDYASDYEKLFIIASNFGFFLLACGIRDFNTDFDGPFSRGNRESISHVFSSLEDFSLDLIAIGKLKEVRTSDCADLLEKLSSLEPKFAP